MTTGSGMKLTASDEAEVRERMRLAMNEPAVSGYDQIEAVIRAAVTKARNDALDEAANVCEARYGGSTSRESAEARRCAAAIRALKTTKPPGAIMTDKLREALLLMLDHVDYTAGACGLGEPVGGCLPRQIIAKARAALAHGAPEPERHEVSAPRQNAGDR